MLVFVSSWQTITVWYHLDIEWKHRKYLKKYIFFKLGGRVPEKLGILGKNSEGNGSVIYNPKIRANKKYCALDIYHYMYSYCKNPNEFNALVWANKNVNKFIFIIYSIWNLTLSRNTITKSFLPGIIVFFNFTAFRTKFEYTTRYQTWPRLSSPKFNDTIKEVQLFHLRRICFMNSKATGTSV